MKESKGLRVFVRDECANYSKHDESCLFGDSCKVLGGERCGYFQKAVLGPPDYPYKLPGYDYAKLFGQYAEQTGADAQKVKQRHCGCGAPLLRRQRCCEKCRNQRRRQTFRNNRRSKSLVRNS